MTLCKTHTSIENQAFLEVLNERICSDRIPLCGSIDLTARCNLKCVHCYIRSDSGGGELGTEQILKYITDIADAGCLFLLLTGGEPFLRNDFRTIYEHAKRVGLLVSIFTNATLIDEKMADFLEEFPPQVVEVTIYGAVAATHDRITGVDGSFAETMRGFGLLRERGIDLMLKTILMTLNAGEMEGMLDIARVNGVGFRSDGAIFPRLDGDRAPLELRLSPEEVVGREFMIPGRSEHWRDFVKKVGKLEPSRSLYDCGAGVSCFHITSDGRLKPCVMAPGPEYDLSKKSFSDAWREMAVISDRKPDPGYPCADCDRRLLCDSCPGFFGLENGDEGVYSEYVCEIAREREMRVGGSKQ